MKNLLLPSLLLISAALAATPAAAQIRSNLMRGGVSSTVPVPRIGNPGVTLSAPATSGLQAQEQDNYAAQLRSEQSQLQQQTAGLTRREINIDGALNGFTPH